ncbi:Cation diffusion facilitator family transporter [Elusimicrobium minutum Pei191]|uniref:Cation diffusion facilitator family transporter n=1 Tax=Elusimicrobium minutum (strain Pei191) TaxID=445932 RepID=B2KD68_ELUMP|nr:cation diffusion facilitator family transporter [Elusimicrobium minutum]ACC98464.1 Cation diffusion facilitator family transporter [Elusimicrobium minutum Pei191]
MTKKEEHLHVCACSHGHKQGHHAHALHEHGHRHHDHGAGASKKALLISFILIIIFMVVELAGGLISGSLALLSDAGHMFSDAFALGLSLTAVIAGQRAATKTKTYGYRRFEVLAAFFNAITIFLIAVFILKEAVVRIQNPAPILSGYMFIIAVIGLLVNIAVLMILRRREIKDNINVKGALLHVLGDILGSVGVIIAAALIYFFGWYIADPIISVIVAFLILYSAWKIFAETVNILLEGAPGHINIEALKSSVCVIKGVVDAHDMHVWSISSGFLVLTAHITVSEDADRDLVLEEARKIIADNASIEHVTIQIESCEHKNSCNGRCN